MQGEGVYEDEIGRYEGQFQAGYKEGNGQLFYKEGKIFRGLFSMNSCIAGELTLEDGTRLDGEWRSDSKFSGSGTISYPNGDFYSGSWSNLIPNKVGKMEYKQGKTYYGEWLRGLMHGTGTLEYVNGDVYQG